jgi:hypothetical protein
MKGRFEFEYNRGRWQFIVVVSYLPSSEFEMGLRGDSAGGALNLFIAGIGVHVSAFRYPPNV